MPSSEPQAGRSEDGSAAPRITVVPGPGTDTDISPEIAAARLEVLRAWLPRFLRTYAHRFPASGTVLGRPAPPPPFPECWPEHPELVIQLQYIKMMADQIDSGEAGPFHIADWFAFLDNRFVPIVQLIGRICRNGHIDVTAPRREREETVSPPPLPGVALRPKAGRAHVTGWRDYVPAPARPVEPRETEGV